MSFSKPHEASHVPRPSQVAPSSRGSSAPAVTLRAELSAILVLVPLLVPGAALGSGSLQLASPAQLGVLCVDEAHHNVHRAGDRYRELAKLGEDLGFEVSAVDTPALPTTLAACRILVIAGARGAGREQPLSARGAAAFTEAEIDALLAWIEGGGGLLLVTDHSPLGRAVEALATRLGVELRDSFTEDPQRAGTAPGEIVFARGAGLDSAHPILDGDPPVDRVVTALGLSLRGPEGSTSLLTLGPAARDRWRATSDDRTWNEPSDSDRLEPAAGRSQGLAFERGAGRVVILGEAGMLTGQALATFPAHVAFARGLLRWLGTREADPDAPASPGSSESG